MMIPDLSGPQIERLALLLEELGEAQQAIGKVLRHGYESHHPDHRPEYTNRKDLEKELGHVLAAMRIMSKNDDLDLVEVQISKEKKLVSVQEYLHWHDGLMGIEKEG